MSRNRPSTAVSSRLLEKRRADATDIDFICGCILFGARKGHYAFNAENPFHVSCLRNEIHSIVSSELLLDQRRATASVYMLDSVRIATLITSEAGAGSRCLEIYALSILKKYQNQGYGSLILDDLINDYPYTDIYARCSPASDGMYKLLSNRGFHFLGTDRDHRVLRRDSAPAAMTCQQTVAFAATEYKG